MPVESDADILGMFDAGEFGVAAAWAPGWGRDWSRTLLADLQAGTYLLSTAATDLTVIRDDPTDRAFGGGAGAMAGQMEVMLPAASLAADPLRDDVMTIDGASFAIEAAASDIDRLTWRATLAEA